MIFSGIPVSLNEQTSLTDVKNLLIQYRDLSINCDKQGWPEGDRLRRIWTPKNPGESIDIKSFNFENKTYNYIFLNALVERAKNNILDSNNNLLDRDKRINPSKADVLFYEYNQKVYMIVYLNLVKYNPKLNAILKDLLKEEYWGERTVLPVEYHITDDMYYWMLYKIMSEQNEIEASPKVDLKTFTGFNGTISETNGDHSMIGEGERISALLSTLAFIFGDDSLKSLKLEMCIKDEDSYSFELSYQGNIILYEHNVNGSYGVNNIVEEQAKQTLIIYKVLIPVIFKAFAFATNIENNLWNSEIKKQFLQDVGQQIILRVNKVLVGEEYDEVAPVINQ